jgi:hypothetical protein
MADHARPRVRSPRTESPALLKGLLVDPTGRAMTPTYTRKNGRLYRYYVSQTALRQGYGTCPIKTVPAGEVETAVIDQVRALLRTPEVIVRTWKESSATGKQIDEFEVTTALRTLDPLWEQLFPAEQTRLIHLLVARATLSPEGVRIDLRTDGLATLIADLTPAPTPAPAAPATPRAPRAPRIQESHP